MNAPAHLARTATDATGDRYATDPATGTFAILDAYGTPLVANIPADEVRAVIDEAEAFAAAVAAHPSSYHPDTLAAHGIVNDEQAAYEQAQADADIAAEAAAEAAAMREREAAAEAAWAADEARYGPDDAPW